jgi:hypothetical protein
MKKYRRMRYLRQTELLHFIYPETEPMFKGEPAYNELIDKSETVTIIEDQHGRRIHRHKIS